MSTIGSMKLLGDLLVSKGLISAWQLEAALQEQRSTRELLGAILMRKGWLTEEILLKTLGEQLEIPYVSLKLEEVEWTGGKLFPILLMEERNCFPIRMERTSVTVAIANPLDAWAISELEKTAGSRGLTLRLVLAPAAVIREAVQRFRQRPQS